MAQISLSMHTASWPVDNFVPALSEISRVGFTGIEVPAGIVDLFLDRPEVFAEILSECGLSLVAANYAIRMPTTPEAPPRREDEAPGQTQPSTGAGRLAIRSFSSLAAISAIGGQADTVVEDISRCTSIARFLSQNEAGILVVRLPLQEKAFANEQWGLLMELLDRIGRGTAEHDVKTCVLPGVNTVAGKRKELEKLLKNTSSDTVFLCADTAHLMSSRIAPYEFARKHAKRLAHVHLSDVSRATGKSVQLGGGRLDIKRFLKTLAKKKYNGWLTVGLPGGSERRKPSPKKAFSVCDGALEAVLQ